MDEKLQFVFSATFKVETVYEAADYFCKLKEILKDITTDIQFSSHVFKDLTNENNNQTPQ